MLLMAGVTAADAKSLKVGDRAPDFEMTMIDGSKVRLADLRGKVVMLNFWATWCGPCKSELPLLNTFQRILAPKGLRVYAIATEDSVPASKLKPLFAALAIPSARRIKGPYAVLGALPTNFVIDRAGVIRYAEAGAFDLNALNRVLIPLMNEPEPVG